MVSQQCNAFVQLLCGMKWHWLCDRVVNYSQHIWSFSNWVGLSNEMNFNWVHILWLGRKTSNSLVVSRLLHLVACFVSASVCHWCHEEHSALIKSVSLLFVDDLIDGLQLCKSPSFNGLRMHTIICLQFL